MKRLLVFLLLAGCDSETIKPCTNIPDGGCPLSYGQACNDPSCAAAYACLPGNKWELRMTCPPRDASAMMDAGARDASLDVQGAWGGPGCASLQMPDCPLGLAAQCNQGCCGCEDLFVCKDGGWDLWGTCSDAGIKSQ